MNDIVATLERCYWCYPVTINFQKMTVLFTLFVNFRCLSQVMQYFDTAIQQGYYQVAFSKKTSLTILMQFIFTQDFHVVPYPLKCIKFAIII